MKQVSLGVCVCVCVGPVNECVCVCVYLQTWRKYIKNFADAFSASLTKLETLDFG